MGVSSRYVLHQGKVLGALGRSAAVALRQQLLGGGAAAAITTPGPELRRKVKPLPRALVDDYVRHVGGEPRAYKGELPPHLFPQWCMPVLARTLEGLPYPLLRVVNGGCDVRVHGVLRDDEPLVIRARLETIDDDGARAVLHQRVVTGTASAPDALEIDFQAIVVLSNKDKAGGGDATHPPKPRQKAHAPADARELARYALGRDAGLSFAKLTGDFNPIHWVPAYAKASGFGSVILHGFGTFARAWEGLNRGLFAGDVHALRRVSCKLTRPLLLPHEVGLYVQGHELFVADAAGGPAYLTGTFEARGGA